MIAGPSTRRCRWPFDQAMQVREELGLLRKHPLKFDQQRMSARQLETKIALICLPGSDAVAQRLDGSLCTQRKLVIAFDNAGGIADRRRDGHRLIRQHVDATDRSGLEQSAIGTAAENDR